MSEVNIPEVFTLGNLEALRVSRGWQRPELAAKSGVTVRAIRELETQPVEPQLGTAIRLALALGCPVEALYSRDFALEVVRVSTRRGRNELGRKIPTARKKMEAEGKTQD